MSPRSQQGATLVELVIAIVVISMAATTLVGLLSYISRNSAERMTLAQSATIANAYLKEVLNNDFADVDSYDGRVDNGVVDGLGNPVPALSGYTVAIRVVPAALDTVPSSDSKLVTVTVTDPLGSVVRLSGFRTQHP